VLSELAACVYFVLSVHGYVCVGAACVWACMCAWDVCVCVCVCVVCVSVYVCVCLCVCVCVCVCVCRCVCVCACMASCRTPGAMHPAQWLV
jgi:hypothetical protein